MRLRISRAARNDLVGIWTFIAEDNPSRAEAFLDALYGTFQMLSDNPEIGRRRDELRTGIRNFSGEPPVGELGHTASAQSLRSPYKARADHSDTVPVPDGARITRFDTHRWLQHEEGPPNIALQLTGTPACTAPSSRSKPSHNSTSSCVTQARRSPEKPGRFNFLCSVASVRRRLPTFWGSDRPGRVSRSVAVFSVFAMACSVR